MIVRINKDKHSNGSDEGFERNHVLEVQANEFQTTCLPAMSIRELEQIALKVVEYVKENKETNPKMISLDTLSAWEYFSKNHRNNRKKK